LTSGGTDESSSLGLTPIKANNGKKTLLTLAPILIVDSNAEGLVDYEEVNQRTITGASTADQTLIFGSQSVPRNLDQTWPMVIYLFFFIINEKSPPILPYRVVLQII
jgi:hypothetical protein